MAIIKNSKSVLTLPNGDKVTVYLTDTNRLRFTFPKNYSLAGFADQPFGNLDGKPVLYLNPGK